MNLTRKNLYRIIVEEYLLEEGLDLEENSQAVEDLLKKIQGDKYREPETRDPARYATKDGETYPMEKPHMLEDNVEETVYDLVKDLSEDEVTQIFNNVYLRLHPEAEDSEGPPPESLYSPGAEGRPVAGFQLEELMGLIREVLKEEGDLDFDEWIDTLLTTLTDKYGSSIDHEDKLPESIAYYKELHARGTCPYSTADEIALDY